MIGYSPCPNHEGHSYHDIAGFCSCGSNHRRRASKWNPGGMKLPVATITEAQAAWTAANTYDRRA